jgi:phospholipase C
MTTVKARSSAPVVFRAARTNHRGMRTWLALALANMLCTAAVTLSPASLSFGNQVLGVPSTAMQLTLTNRSAKAITISSVMTGLSDYTQINNCPATLAVNASCAISVTFTPTALGTRTDTLQVLDSAPNSPQKVSLSGTGVAAVTATPATLNFGNQFLRVKSSAQSITVTNNKTTAITVTSIVSSLSDYLFTTTCPVSPNTLAGSGSCTISAYFTPTDLGTRTRTLTILTDAGANPAVNLTGSGILPAAVSPGSLNFAAQLLGTASPPQTVTLTNNQKKPLKITSITASPSDFADATTCPLSPSTVAGGASCTVSVTFSPKEAGTSTGTLTFIDDATNSPQTVTLSGVGNLGTSAIQHVVIIVKQNRSFDNYFGTFPGADGVTAGPISTGQTIVFPRQSDKVQAEVGNSRDAYLSAIDGGKMDRFDIIPSGNINGEYNALGQLLQSDIPNYWSYASNFVLADRMFSSQLTAGFANQLVYITGSANGVIDNPANTAPGLPPKWGCDSDPGGLVPVMDSRGVITKVFPCFDFTTMADRLMDAGLTWRFYGALPGQIDSEWSAFDAISHIRNSPSWNNVISWDQFVTDAAAGNLPTVTWLIAAKGSEHPKASSCVGENWTVEQVNAIMQGPLWNSTAIFITWDDPGGFFDHVAPPPGPEPFSLGERVPLLIISPYAKAGYVSHTQYDMTSTLKFIETVFNLPPLANRDAMADNMLDNFDFTQAPRPPLVLNTRLCPLVPRSSMVFGSVAVGAKSSAISVPLTNYGTTPVTISSISVTSNFNLQNGCPKTLAAGASCDVDVTFSPTSVGSASGNLTLSATDSPTPHVVPLSGIGTNVTASASSSVFGRTPVGTTSAGAMKVTLTNQGGSDVGITGVQTVGDFSQTNNCGTSLGAGLSCTVTVTFKPGNATGTGLVYGAIFINHTDPGSPARVLVSGNSTQLSITPRSMTLTFPSQNLGTASASQPVQLTNVSNTAVQLDTPSPSGDFSESTTCGQTLAPGATCNINVTFTPTAGGTRTGKLTLSYSDLTSPQAVILTGTGH